MKDYDLKTCRTRAKSAQNPPIKSVKLFGEEEETFENRGENGRSEAI